MADLGDRRILVTGASSGIGEAIARALAAEGATVALMARSAVRLEALAVDIGGIAVPGDVTDPAAVDTAVGRAAASMGGIDGLVNDAGVARFDSPTQGDPADWRLMFEVNVLGLLSVTRSVVPHLRAAGRGDLVNISSMSGRRIHSPEATVYAASKFAVHAISEGLRRELNPDGIRVVTIAPGYVDTPIFSGMEDDERRRELEETVESVGLDPGSVAAQVVHAISQPAEVNLVEIAMMNIRQA